LSILKALWDAEEQATAEAYARQPDRPEAAFDPAVWERPWELRLAGLRDDEERRCTGPPASGRAPGDILEELGGGMTDWQERILAKSDVCHGKPCIRGTRIMVSVVLDNLAEGLSPQEIVADYPPLTVEDVRAALAYAAVLTREEELVPLR
jgi:uncharacterized protein (DUF433 family)